MFFKKKKTMTDNINDNDNAKGDNNDNMAQNEEMDDIQSFLNIDGKGDTGGPGDEAKTEEILKLQVEIDELKDKHIRLIAEFDNFRRRTAKEKAELFQTAGKDVIQSLLVVLDDMSRADKQIESAKDIAAIKEGVFLVFSKLRTILQQKGLKVMETGNEEFNADLHEAITEIPAIDEKMKGKIIDVIDPGYYLNDKLIRYAKVVVGN